MVQEVHGQLCRDCPCFLSQNYFVGEVAVASMLLNQHFHFRSVAELEDEDDLLEAICLQLGPDRWDLIARGCRDIISAEYQRRRGLDENRAQVRLAASTVWDDAAAKDNEQLSRMRQLIQQCTASLSSASPFSRSSSPTAVSVFDIVKDSLAPGARAIYEASVMGDASGAVKTLLATSTVNSPGRAVWELDLLSSSFCADLMHYLSHWSVVCAGVKGRPNSMNRLGVLVDEVDGGAWTRFFVNPLLSHVLRPLASQLFPEDGGATLDHHRCFTVVYVTGAQSSDAGLATHFDNAEVTLNVHLGGSWGGGGELELLGWQGHGNDDAGPGSTCSSSYLRVPPLLVPFKRPGVALVHRGRELHGARPIIQAGAPREVAAAIEGDSGRDEEVDRRDMHQSWKGGSAENTRMNLILWARSSMRREDISGGCPMCGSCRNVLPLDALLRRQTDLGLGIGTPM